MAKYQGFASIQTPEDLLAKLRRDHKSLLNEPNDPDINFDFFVTAYHMLDWILPGKENIAARKALERKEPLLQLCSNLANGAKHFIPEDPKHDSVANVQSGGYVFDDPYTGKGFVFADPRTGLRIQLDGAASEKHGKTVLSPDLATLVLEFWEQYIHTIKK